MKTKDEFKFCRMCKKVLTDSELKDVELSGLPALCAPHLEKAKENLKKCAPLFAKINCL